MPVDKITLPLLNRKQWIAYKTKGQHRTHILGFFSDQMRQLNLNSDDDIIKEYNDIATNIQFWYYKLPFGWRYTEYNESKYGYYIPGQAKICRKENQRINKLILEFYHKLIIKKLEM